MTTAAKILKYLILIFAFGSLVLFVFQTDRNYASAKGNDTTVYVESSGKFFSGENPYEISGRPYIYPLFLLILVYPLTLLQTGFILKLIAGTIWVGLIYYSLFMVLGSIWKKTYGYATIREALFRNYFQIALIVTLLHPFLQDEVLNGQVNIFVMALTMAYFWLLYKNRQLAAGLVIAAAASIKISPALGILMIFLTGQYRVILYFVLSLTVFNLVIPYFINSESINYYTYFVKEVVPFLIEKHQQFGFKNFSLISTLSYILDIRWNPLVKIAAVGLTALAFFVPVKLIAPNIGNSRPFLPAFISLAAIVVTIPISFPMSEVHHLTYQTIPLIIIMIYWQEILRLKIDYKGDALFILFIICLVMLHVGHAVKESPLRLIALLGIYAGLLMLLYRIKSGRPKVGMDRDSLDSNQSIE